MFESDDFDQVLSQFDFPEVDKTQPEDILIPYREPLKQHGHRPTTESQPGCQDFIDCTNTSKIDGKKINEKPKETGPQNSSTLLNYETEHSTKNITSNVLYLDKKGMRDDNFVSKEDDGTTNNKNFAKNPIEPNLNSSPQVDSFVSPKHLKRKIINSHFDQLSKRKFPGPAGLLTGVLEEAKDESIAQMEFLSQDMDFTENNLQRDLFESPLWKRLLRDTEDWKLHRVDSIKAIKQQALAGNLRRRKAQTVTAFIEAVDRSITDVLIILRDETGSIKCTLHRDAWSSFSPYMVAGYCALVLHKPTVLTTGGAFKKHYLNITLSNILAIFSSAVLQEKALPDGYRIMYEDDFTVIKTDRTECSENIETPFDSSNGADELFDGLDSFFSDEIF